MKNVLDYERLLGKLVLVLIVRKKLENIFAYRYPVLEKLFNKNS